MWAASGAAMAADWNDYYIESFHRERAGITEEVPRGMRSEASFGCCAVDA